MSIRFALLCYLAIGCKGKEKSKSELVPSTAPSTAPTIAEPGTSEPSRPVLAPAAKPVATTQALGKAIEALAAEENPANDAKLAEALALESPKTWFAETFGDTGEGLSLTYESELERGELASVASRIRHSRRAQKRHRMTVEKFENADDPNATGFQSRAIAAMAVPQALYSVRFSKPGGGASLHLRNFIHDGEQFRYVGELANAGGAPTASSLVRLKMRQREQPSK